MIIRIIEENDLDKVASLHAEAFTRQRNSREWLLCTIKAFPRTLCYVVEEQNQIHGYIIWAQKSGFRPEAVIELEQIAVHPNQQNRGIGQNLIEQSSAIFSQPMNSIWLPEMFRTYLKIA